ARPTGIGYYSLGLLRAMSASGRFEFVGLAHGDVHAAEELDKLGIPVEVEPAPLGVWWQQTTLPRRLARGDLDLFFSPLTTLPLRSKLPSVVTVHDLTALLYPETHRLKVRWSQMPFLGPSLRRAGRIVAVSEATARDVRFAFPEVADKVRVVANGVDEEFRPADPETIERLRAELDCPRGYMLYSGTLEPRKNLQGLLDAWEALADDEGDPLPLFLAGDYGWRNRSLLRRIERLGPRGVTYLGRLERRRLLEVMQAATIFVYPSFYEGFGLPVAEAMACGVPTVVSDRSSLPEVVGEAGLKVDPEDARGIAVALRRLLREEGLRARLAERGLARVANFRWARSGEEMAAIFDEALALE
ncbi:MAG TPA: glycosyltransferase family 1 protein, partial [Thermoanaerobaculia bacterium]|nr:glycosyltransferase family 1 protein [Thermoanaerobaculia bacterium]